MMFQKLFVLSLFLCLAADCSKSRGQESAESDPVFLLLQNGNVLKGAIRHEKERLAVIVDGNSTLYLASKQVLFVGPNLESLYQHQRSGIRQWGTGEHWQLAHWCIQQGLINHAIEHFKVLEQTASDSPRFKQLEHALRESLLANENVQQLLQSRKQTDEPPPIKAPQSSDVVQASAVTTSVKNAQSTRDETESADSWNKHEIPSYIRKTFQNSILPVLVSRCGQSGCHGMLGKTEFHIYQPIGEQSSILLTRDLNEALKYIDRDNIQNSVLLSYATKAHGIQRNPSLSPLRSDEKVLIERIQFWIKSLELTKKPESTMPVLYPSVSVAGSEVTSAVARVQATNNNSRKSKRVMEVEEDRDAKLSKPARNAPPTEFISMSEIADLEQAIEKFEKQLGTSGPSSAQKDPFAPDVFNRKYR